MLQAELQMPDKHIPDNNHAERLSAVEVELAGQRQAIKDLTSLVGSVADTVRTMQVDMSKAVHELTQVRASTGKFEPKSMLAVAGTLVGGLVAFAAIYIAPLEGRVRTDEAVVQDIQLNGAVKTRVDVGQLVGDVATLTRAVDDIRQHGSYEQDKRLTVLEHTVADVATDDKRRLEEEASAWRASQLRK